MCECHQIGGRFIAEDPDCPVHGTEAQERDRDRVDLLQQIAELRAELAAERERIAQHFDSRDKGAGSFYDLHEPAEALPLPEARKPDEHGAGWFTAGQMRAYAAAAVANAAVSKAQFQVRTNTELNTLQDQVRLLKAAACVRLNNLIGNK